MCSRKTHRQTQPHGRTDPAQTKLQVFVDLEEGSRDDDANSDCLRTKQVDLEDSGHCKCSSCGIDDIRKEQMQSFYSKKPRAHASGWTHWKAELEPISKDADFNFFEKGKTDLCEFQQSIWAPLPEPLVVDSGAGETVMPIDWLTNHPLTESDGSRANDFNTTADGSKVYTEGQRKLDVCTLDGQQRRSMTFQIAKVKKAMGSVAQMVRNGNRLGF